MHFEILYAIYGHFVNCSYGIDHQTIEMRFVNKVMQLYNNQTQNLIETKRLLRLSEEIKMNRDL